MTDDTLPDRDEVASAYLDGELEPGERARAEADPETMARVESFRSLRTTLGDVPPASMPDRASGLASALSEYDALAPMRRLTPLSELEPRRHHRNRWVLSAAAAAVVIIAVVAVVASGGSDNKKSASEPRNSTAAAPAPTSTKVGAAAVSTTVATGTAADSQTAPASVAAGGGGADPGAPTPINSPAALRQFAVASAAATVSGPPCTPAGDTVLGYITFLNIPAYAVVDGADGTIKALAASDCRQLISVSP